MGILVDEVPTFSLPAECAVNRSRSFVVAGLLLLMAGATGLCRSYEHRLADQADTILKLQSELNELKRRPRTPDEEPEWASSEVMPHTNPVGIHSKSLPAERRVNANTTAARRESDAYLVAEDEVARLIESSAAAGQIMESIASVPHAELYAALSDFFEAEGVNAEWAYETEQKVYALLGEDEFLSSYIQDVTCKTNQCQFSALAVDSDTTQRVMEQLHARLSSRDLYSQTSALIPSPSSKDGSTSILLTTRDVLTRLRQSEPRQ